MADAIGASLSKKGRRMAWQLCLRQLRRKQMSTRPGTDGKGSPPVLVKNGVPASNTAADAPGQKYVFIYDALNKDVYFCTAYTNTTTFTIVKLDV